MAKYCTNCGKELNENAELCLNCGVFVKNSTNNNVSTNNEINKKKKGLPTWAIVLIVVGSILLIPVIIFIVIGLIAYNTIDNAIDKVEDEIDNYYEQTTTHTGTIGDTLKTDKLKITLKEALMYSSVGEGSYLQTPAEGKEYLIFFFDIENISDENEYISYYEFDGYVDGYTVSVKNLFNEVNDTEELSANLSPKMKTRGFVAFEVDSSWEEFEIHYSELFGYKDELVFKVINPDNNNLSA